MQNGGTINNLTKNPTKLKIYALDSCTNIDFKNSGNFHGAIYAPTADVHQYNSVQLYGAVVANNFRQDVNADFNYDASLRDVGVNDEGARFVIKKWSE
jgi:choice-of-anchor A domain-containing protein